MGVIKPVTVGELFDLYYERHVLVNLKCPSNAKYFASVHGPRWFSVPIVDVKRSDVQEWVDEYGLKSRSSATRAVGQLAAMFMWGIKREYCPEPNPCRWIEKFRHVSRDRFLEPEELDRFKRALDQETETIFDFFWMLLLTGARKGNLLSMRWDELNFPLALWRIPADKFKNGETSVVVLGAPALVILQRRKLTATSEWVFPGRIKGEHMTSPKKAWERILKRADLKDLHIHDLRRTVGSYMAINGASAYIIGKALGHRDQRSTAVYARLDLATVRTAYEGVFASYNAAPPEPPTVPSVSAEIIRFPSKSSAVLATDMTPMQKIMAESRIIASIKDRRCTKKAFYRKVGDIKAAQLEEIVQGMIARNLIYAVPDKLIRNVTRYELCENNREVHRIAALTKRTGTRARAK